MRDRIDQSQWADALVQEIGAQAALAPDRPLRSIFFGGGTPSLMAPATVEAVINAARDHWSFANDIEITLEANPTSVEESHFAGYRLAGVNRVSLGVQALDDDALRFLGREHSVAEAMGALDTAQRTFDRVSFDLIYGRAGQTADAWEAELRQAISLGTRHLSLYQLTIEPGTVFGSRAEAGKILTVDDDRGADLYELTQALTNDAGLPAYEISNHAAPGQESTHNMIYWRGGDWLGIGPGAHSRISTTKGRLALANLKGPEEWLSAVTGEEEMAEQKDILTVAEDAEEQLMMGLRLAAGISFTDALQSIVSKPQMTDLIETGYLKKDGDRLCATAKGRPVLNHILAKLIA